MKKGNTTQTLSLPRKRLIARRRVRARFRALIVADRPHWVFDRKARMFRALSQRFNVDIRYVCANDASEQWTPRLRKHQYDIVWKLGYRMGHDPVNRDHEPLRDFIREQNHRGTAVVATVSNSLVHFDLPKSISELPRNGNHPHISRQEWDLLRATHAEESADSFQRRAAEDAARLRLFNGVSVNNKFAYTRLTHAGVPCRIVQDGVDLNIFRCTRPVLERPFGVLFVSSQKKQVHKGIELFRDMTEKLKQQGVACRALVADSSNNRRTPHMMRSIYNRYPIFVCASRAEGGPATLLESAACGCVPICTPVGYTAEIIGRSNGYIVRRRAEAFVEKILRLQEDEDLLQQMSDGVRAAVVPYDWTQRVAGYEQFLLDHLPA